MFMLPGYVHIAADLPRNPNGKIDRKALSGEFAQVFATTDTPA
jgi:acyl-coenzyme A synthetase/AMP-(fatty) acid ligase